MSYLWEQFNIKTFPARTVVFLDGEFRADLSSAQSSELRVESLDHSVTITNDVAGELPVHMIYVGEISGDKKIIIRNNASSQLSTLNSKLYLTAKLSNKKPAFLTFFIENAGKNSEFSADMVFLNESELKFDVFADHLAENTGIFVKNRALVGPGSATELYGVAKIVGECPNCHSDISFAAMAAPDIKYIKLSPNQKIASIPDSAEHAASIWRGTQTQIEYLKTAGLSASAVDSILREAFLNG
ncbi:MAG: SufD family Fe-S cluster assembly protein [Proteobacteria bacterium]|nr:SufD family Fe-S cluster assembly protein [Pseudomonadota bacterium]